MCYKCVINIVQDVIGLSTKDLIVFLVFSRAQSGQNSYLEPV